MRAKSPGALTLLGLLLLPLLTSCVPDDLNSDTPPAGESWESLRSRMVEGVESRGVKHEKVLEAMRKAPRHRFLPRKVTHYAYEQSPVPIGEDQTISSPYIVGRMTELLDLDGSEKVLEIGTGSGYQAAVLAHIVPKVYTIEIRPNLAKSAGERLKKLGYKGVVVRCGDGYQGWDEEAPFDAIIVTAAPPEIPKALEEQLARGGRMVVPVGKQDAFQMLTLIRKDEEGNVTTEVIERVVFVPMIRPE
ncbi:MAG: protein-L-isoaspartate(D-aspartate) O-methyltransferase [Planctomycetota bacterium]|jgi:protein-L-isoaspartate(D-aspartate) O-methyltransferase